MNEPKPKRRRRWYQFSLRTLMLFMLVCAIGFGWLGKRLDETRRERVMVVAIEKFGGSVLYHEPCLHWNIRHLGKVGAVNLVNTQVTDAGLVHLKGLTSLKSLSLDRTQVTDAGLVHLKGLTSLKSLNLGNTRVTDAGLEHLKGLTNLGFLQLRNTRVSNIGLEHLGRMKRLYLLQLQGTQVSDEGVERLQQALPNCTIRSRPLGA